MGFFLGRPLSRGNVIKDDGVTGSEGYMESDPTEEVLRIANIPFGSHWFSDLPVHMYVDT